MHIWRLLKLCVFVYSAICVSLCSAVDLVNGVKLFTSFVNASGNSFQNIASLKSAFQEQCKKNINFDTLKAEWNHNSICTKWLNFSDIGTFDDLDFQMHYPRHLSKLNDKWKEDVRSDYLKIPRDFCVFRTAGWFTQRGALFDCEKQYPLVMKQGQRDTDLTMYSGSLDPNTAASQHFKGPIFSMVMPYNEAFSHAFSTGVSICVYALYLMRQHDEQQNVTSSLSRILIPSGGPFKAILETLGLPHDRIIVAERNEVTYHSPEATLILRRPPFNVVQAHWPAHALCDMRDKTVEWLRRHGYMNNTSSNNLVVYLWRDGARDMHNQGEFVEKIRQSIKPGYELVVLGKNSKINYDSKEAHFHWRVSAHLFVHAAAVIGPHGGAFGNIFLVSRNTTIIEFNLPWTPVAADGDSSVNTVRDMFYSLARGIGNVNHYWNVWPTNQFGNNLQSFYTLQNMQIDVAEVIEILRIEGIAK